MRAATQALIASLALVALAAFAGCVAASWMEADAAGAAPAAPTQGRPEVGEATERLVARARGRDAAQGKPGARPAR